MQAEALLTGPPRCARPGRRRAAVIGLAAAAAAAACVTLSCAGSAGARRGGAAKAPEKAPGKIEARVQDGKASYYADKFVGRRTASGETYDPHAMTAAHLKLPFGTRVRVTRVGGPSVIVKVNDRCGCTHGRIIDLSRAAAERLQMLRVGVVPVRLEVLGP